MSSTSLVRKLHGAMQKAQEEEVSTDRTLYNVSQTIAMSHGVHANQIVHIHYDVATKTMHVYLCPTSKPSLSHLDVGLVQAQFNKAVHAAFTTTEVAAIALKVYFCDSVPL
tara:strand:+ start:353 stop:685 length:333 start_codon:yes stop_codon:yes gene_type:complete